MCADQLHDQLRAQFERDRDDTVRSMLTWSLASLGVLGVAADALGWLLAGRALRPLAQITATGNTQVSANERYSRLAGAYGPILAGSRVNGDLICTGNSADVKDFGAPNRINRDRGGDCAAL